MVFIIEHLPVALERQLMPCQAHEDWKASVFQMHRYASKAIKSCDQSPRHDHSSVPLCPTPAEVLRFLKGSLHRKTTLQNLVHETARPLKYLPLCALRAGAEKRGKGKKGLQVLVSKLLPAQNAPLTFNGDRRVSALV